MIGAAVGSVVDEFVGAVIPLESVFVVRLCEDVKVAVSGTETPTTIRVVPSSTSKTEALASGRAVSLLQHAIELSLLGEQQKWLAEHSMTLFHIDGSTGNA